MNGMNKAIVGIVLGIALVYSIGSFVLTAIEIWNTGDITIVMFMPHLKDGAFDLDYRLGELSGIALGYYDRFVDYILDDLIHIEGDSRKFIVLAVAAAGFAMSVIGFAVKPTFDVKGRTNPAEYLWTHRPEAFARAVLTPWGFLTGMWYIKKPLVIIPIILLPLYAWWSLLMTALIVIPFLIVKAVVSMKISRAAKLEKREYGKSTQYAVCPVCKRNFRRPNVKCQKCGLVLDYPVPNIYGYKYHTCNKGHEIPCQSGKRGNLHTVCPHCNADIETREAKPIAVAMVGACGSGKTTMMLAMVKTVTASGRARDISVDASTHGISRSMTDAKDYAPPTSSGELDSECMFIRSRTLSDREILVNDISGHEFEAKQGKSLFEEYFTYSDGIVFAFDPVMLAKGRGQTPMEVFESFHYMFTQINQVSPSHVSKVPFAVVATHSDVSKIKDGDVRQYLQDNGQEAFVRVLESLFTTVSYFSVCSAGEECSSAAKPFWWIAGLVDRELVEAIPVERCVRASK